MTGLNESVIAKAFGLPSEGQLFCDSTVLASGVDTEKNRWFVITDGTVQRTAAQAALKPSLNRTKYFTHDDRVFEAISGSKFQMEVVRTNPSGGVQTVIGGSMSYTRVRKNPVSVADFRSEMKDMFVSDPRRDFKEYDAPKLHSEAFRDRLFTFVSYRGESYGWVKGGKIYHRRGSLIMPKLKVNKAVEGATVFYHTHPSKDEPSLSSADDYQFYADLAFAFGIKHFYTIMENRIDHFTFTVKKSKEEDYLKMDEDKLLDDFNSMIDEAEASVTKKHKGNKNMTDEKFYETITRGAVTKMNSRFKQFFTISYKGHAKPGLVRENPGVAGFRHNPPVRISHIHRASQLDELRDTTNNYEHYGANEFGHSHYVYWWIDHHFSATPAHPKARLWKLKEYGLSDEARRKLRAYMSEEVAPGYSKLDILLFLALYHDVGKKREKEEGRHHSIIGAEMFRDEISVELKLPEQVTDTVVHLMMTDVGRKNIDPEVFRTKAGDYLGVAYMLQLADMLAHHPFMYTSYAAEAKEQGLIDKANVHRYKQFAAEQHISNVTKFLNSRAISNPPPKAVSAYFSGSFDTAIDGDIAEIEFSEWEDPDKKMFYNAQLRMRDPVHGVKVTLFLSSGKFIIYFGKDSNRIEGDATFYDTAMDIYRRMGDILSNFTTGMDYESPPEPDIMVNPRHVDKVHLITISGPSGVGKSTIAKTLAGILDADLIPTVTTRPRRPKEKGSRDRIFIKEKQFKEMIEDGAFVEWKRLKNGFYYGRRYSDFKKSIAVIDVTLKGMKKYRDVFPHTTSIFLDPDVSPEELKKRILRRGGMTPEEAEARANIAAKQIEDAHKMDFDMFVKSKTGGFEDVAKQIADDIEIIKQNPPELLPVYDCETCGVKGMTHTNWYCKEHGYVKQNAPLYERSSRATPARLYHGTSARAVKSIFDSGELNTSHNHFMGEGVYLTPSGELAKAYSKRAAGLRKEDARILEIDIAGLEKDNKHLVMRYSRAKHTSVLDKPADIYTVDTPIPTKYIKQVWSAGGAVPSPLPVAKARVNPKEGPDLFSHFERWAKLVNMKNKELKAFLDSPLGKVAGLSPQEAKEQGIFSGRVSGRRILKMRAKIGLGGPKDYIKGPRHLEEKWEEALKKWTGPSKDYMKGTTDWDWCLRQVRFNERHGAFPYNSAAEERKGPLVRKQKTQNQVSRRLLSLWVWGHDPWRWARKHGIARMPKCPDVPWIGMTEKRKYGKVPVLMKPTKKNPPSTLLARDVIDTQDYDRLVRIAERKMKSKHIKHKEQTKRHLAGFGYKGRSPEKAIQAIFKWHLDKWGDKHKRVVYRAIFTNPDEGALDSQWEKYGLMESWGSNKRNADLYVFRPGTLAMMPTGKQALIEAELYFSDVDWRSTISRNLGFGSSEDEINPYSFARLLVKKVSFYELDDRARKKYIDGAMGIGRNWKPWIDPKFKAIHVWKPNKSYPVEGPEFEALMYGPPKENPQTGLPGIGDPPVDPATIQPHLDWPKWTKPDWFPRNLVPQSAVYSPPRTTSLRGKRVTSTPFYYIRQDELDRLLQSQQYLELQEADRQRKIAEAERIRAQHQGTVEDYRTNPSNIPFPVPEEYQEELERRLTDEMTAEGYRPLRVQQDFIDSGGYDDAPSDWSYVQGEYQEFLDEIEAQDWDEAYAEYSDVEGHTAYYLWTNYRIDMPVYTHDHIDKVLFRIRIFEDLFAHYGFEFGPQYLKGGSNYEKVFKVRNALDAAADAQGKSRVKDDDEQLGAVVKKLVTARKGMNRKSSSDNSIDYPDSLDEAFDLMKRVAKKNRELEMTVGFDAWGWWKENKGIIDEKYGKNPVPGASWLMPVFDPDFDPYMDENDPSMDDFYPDGEPNMHFYNQLMRIPQTEPPTPRKILQIALNIGQGQATGIVDEDYTMSDFIAFDNPRKIHLTVRKEKGKDGEPDSTRIDAHVESRVLKGRKKNVGFLNYYEADQLHFAPVEPYIMLSYIKVDKKWRGKGIAKKLMEKFLSMNEGRTIRGFVNNTGIIPFYEQFGFEHGEANEVIRRNPRTPGGKKFPTKYLKGLTAFEKMIAEDEIDKGYKYDADDPEAYKFWKSDIKATARGLKIGSSKHRTKYYKMYRKNIDKDYKPSGSSPKEKFLNRIRKETKIKRSILEKIYDKGLAAWRVGHRPGVAQHQWAAGRVYAFAVGADSSTGKGKPDHKLAVEAGVR